MKRIRSDRPTFAIRILAVLSTAAIVGGLGTPFAAGANVISNAHSQLKTDGKLQLKKESGPDISQGSSTRIQHVVYIIMDNVHMSDIEQMPHLVSFLHQGTLFTNDHTILDSHTQDGML